MKNFLRISAFVFAVAALTFAQLPPVTSSTSAGASTVKVNGGQVSSPNFNNATPAAVNGLNNATPQTSGSNVSFEIYTNFIDVSAGYSSGDPCAYANTAISNTIVTEGNYYDFGGFIGTFSNGLVPCNSNPFENLAFSGEIDLGPLVYITSRPWLTPGGGTQRVTLKGSGTADVGAGATLAVNSMLTDCTATAPAAYNWNGTSCTVNGIVVPTLANGGGHSLSFTFPHGAFGAGTYFPLLWIGGQGTSGVSLAGNFGQVIENFTVAPNGVGGADFGVYSAGSQEQTWCRNVTVRNSNSAAFFFDSVQSTANIGHFSMNGCEGRMDTTETAAQGYPNVANQKGMGYGIFVEGNADVIYFTGGTCTTYPQGYPTTFSGGAITAIKMTYAGSCSSLTGLTCHVGNNSSRGTGETCGITNTGTTVTGITAGGVGTGYSLGDTLSGGPFEIANSSMDGKSGSLMQNAIVLDGLFSPHLMSIHTGWDADYGVVIGYGSGAITGGLFENIDLENTSNGVYRLGVGIDNNQKLLTTGKGGSVATIRDDANNFSSPTNTPISEYDPASFWIPAGQAPIFFNGPATAQILDFTNQLPVLKLISVTSAVDYITVTPAATANPATVTLTAAGTDANINFNIVPKGSGTVECNGSPCGGSSGISGMTALGVPIAATATTITSSTTAGTNQGTYFPVRVNTVQGTAVTLTEQQAGVGGRAITGSTSTDAAAYSDVNNVIDHDNGGSAGVTETLATPTTLNNSSFGAVYWNNSTQTDTLKATTNTIQSGSAAAVAGATGISLLPGQAAAFKVDPNLSTQWLAHVTDQAGFINGGAMPASAFMLGSNSSKQPIAQTIAANTTVANVTGGTAAPTAATIPSGIQNYVAGTGYNQATAHQIQAPWLCQDSSGSGTAQSCTFAPVLTPSANDCMIYTTTTTNSGTGLTIAAGGLAAKSVAIPGASGWTTTLTANIIPPNKPLQACYDGINWNVTQTGTSSSGGGSSLTYWTNCSALCTNSGWTAATTNEEQLGSVIMPVSLSIGHIRFNVATGEATSLYSFGIFNSSGTLLCHTTPAAYASTGVQNVACVEGTVAIPAGKNFLGYTTNSAGHTLSISQVGNLASVYAWNTSFVATTSGAQPGSITPPSDSPSFADYQPEIILAP